ncbi:MAG TPA: hypothetical protein VKV37_03250 [Ktedonobacteraceae bacterium]|nr:hypothetical protein [Ktedonobacteraceae bacterium]
MTDFPSIAFQSSLSSEAILFGVFGFLYSVFGMYSSAADPDRPPVVKNLRVLCRVIALFILINACLTIYSLALLLGNFSNLANVILGAGLGATMIAIAFISIIWSFWHLD